MNEDVFPIENGDFPMSSSFSGGFKSQIPYLNLSTTSGSWLSDSADVTLFMLTVAVLSNPRGGEICWMRT